MLRNIAPDKWKHFFVGIAMGAFLQFLFFYFFNLSAVASSISSFLLSVVISYGFELFSLITGKGHYEVLDAVASMIGATIGIAILISFV